MDYMDFLWQEKYRPQTLDDFVLPEFIKGKLKEWVDQGHFPHLILHGSFGTGKTSIVKYLTNNIQCDVFEVNASKDNKIDLIRDRVSTFLMRSSIFGLKVVVFHEGEELTPRAQKALKEEIEVHSDDTRVIFTTNYIDKLDGAVDDRCTILKVEPDSPTDIAKRIKYILDAEGVKVSDDQKEPLWGMIKEEYPSVRNCVKKVQQYVVDGVLRMGESSDVSQFETILNIINETNSNNKVENFYEIRKITNSLSYTSLSTFYSYLYKNLNSIFSKKDMFDVITLIAEYNYRSSHDIDLELNIASLLKELIEHKVNS